jgi:predicted enzyme related to lactoylglutathione lyase
MEPNEIARLRLHNQRLTGSPISHPEEVVRWLGAVQAQDYAGAKWGLAQRTTGRTEPEIERAFNAGAILRTHAMRPTWHFVTPADIRWIQALTSRRVHALNSLYYRRLEIDGTAIIRSRELIERALEGGRQRTRAELASALQEGGIPASGQRLAYLVMHAELEAVICSGSRRGKQFTYALLDERVPPTPPLEWDEARAELARRYFTSHGPATVRDFAWWSGLTVAEAKAALEEIHSEFEHAHVDGRTYWFAPLENSVHLEDSTIHLLPNYDEHLIAYKDRSAALDGAIPVDLEMEEGALIANVVVRNGLVIGGWRRTLDRKRVSIETQLLLDLDGPGRIALEEAARRFGRFLGMPVSLDGDSLEVKSTMPKIIGIGGVFIFARDTRLLADWYRQHFGFMLEEIPEEDGSATYFQPLLSRDHEKPDVTLQTVFAIMPARDALSDQRNQVMINYRVEDLDGLVVQLNKAGIKTGPVTIQFDGEGRGKFTHLADPEGNRIELWEHTDVMDPAGDTGSIASQVE